MCWASSAVWTGRRPFMTEVSRRGAIDSRPLLARVRRWPFPMAFKPPRQNHHGRGGRLIAFSAYFSTAGVVFGEGYRQWQAETLFQRSTMRQRCGVIIHTSISRQHTDVPRGVRARRLQFSTVFGSPPNAHPICLSVERTPMIWSGSRHRRLSSIPPQRLRGHAEGP
jgi:hypothetical protein